MIAGAFSAVPPKPKSSTFQIGVYPSAGTSDGEKHGVKRAGAIEWALSKDLIATRPVCSVRMPSGARDP
jgi:hypothetical protein